MVVWHLHNFFCDDKGGTENCVEKIQKKEGKTFLKKPLTSLMKLFAHLEEIYFNKACSLRQTRLMREHFSKIQEQTVMSVMVYSDTKRT